MYKRYLIIPSLVLTLLFATIYATKSKSYIKTYSQSSIEISDSIKATVDSYILAFNEGDGEKILSFFCEETLDLLNIDTTSIINDFENVFSKQGKIENYAIKKIEPIDNTLIVATVEYTMNNNHTSEEWVFKNEDSYWKLNNGVISILELNSSINWNDVHFTVNNLVHSIDGTTLLTISFTNNNTNPLIFGLINKSKLIVTTTEKTYCTPVLVSSTYNTNCTDTIISSFNNFTGEIINIEIHGVYLLDSQGKALKDCTDSISLYEI